MKSISQFQVVRKKVTSFPVKSKKIINAKLAAKAIKTFLRHAYDGELPDREVFGVLHLDSKSSAIGIEIISIGILDGAIAHARETFKGAIVVGSKAILLFHNHPSGDCRPSDADIQKTARLIEAGLIIGIEVLDHLIVTDSDHYSLIENNHL